MPITYVISNNFRITHWATTLWSFHRFTVRKPCYDFSFLSKIQQTHIPIGTYLHNYNLPIKDFFYHLFIYYFLWLQFSVRLWRWTWIREQGKIMVSFSSTFNLKCRKFKRSIDLTFTSVVIVMLNLIFYTSRNSVFRCAYIR